jgi:hypothetical protein
VALRVAAVRHLEVEGQYNIAVVHLGALGRRSRGSHRTSRASRTTSNRDRW